MIRNGEKTRTNLATSHSETYELPIFIPKNICHSFRDISNFQIRTMDVLMRDGELPTGTCERKFQSLAFVCPESKFQFIEFEVLKCWRVNDDVIGLARLPNCVRNNAWRRLLPDAKWYVLSGRKRWTEVEHACRRLDVFEDKTQLQAYNDAKRALRLLIPTNGGESRSKQIRSCYRAFVARLQIVGKENAP